MAHHPKRYSQDALDEGYDEPEYYERLPTPRRPSPPLLRKCKFCGTEFFEIKPGEDCPKCGGTIQCKECDARIPGDSRFCNMCGKSLRS